jgi:hypothetical protein
MQPQPRPLCFAALHAPTAQDGLKESKCSSRQPCYAKQEKPSTMRLLHAKHHTVETPLSDCASQKVPTHSRLQHTAHTQMLKNVQLAHQQGKTSHVMDGTPTAKRQDYVIIFLHVCIRQPITKCSSTTCTGQVLPAAALQSGQYHASRHCAGTQAV